MRKQGIDESVGVLRYHIRPLTLSAMGGIPDVLRIGFCTLLEQPPQVSEVTRPPCVGRKI
jgi:hypothetical protein